jgi:hypothetical protein
LRDVVEVGVVAAVEDVERATGGRRDNSWRLHTRLTPDGIIAATDLPQPTRWGLHLIADRRLPEFSSRLLDRHVERRSTYL